MTVHCKLSHAQRDDSGYFGQSLGVRIITHTSIAHTHPSITHHRFNCRPIFSFTAILKTFWWRSRGQLFSDSTVGSEFGVRSLLICESVRKLQWFWSSGTLWSINSGEPCLAAWATQLSTFVPGRQVDIQCTNTAACKLTKVKHVCRCTAELKLILSRWKLSVSVMMPSNFWL